MILQQYIQDTLFRKEPCCLPKTGIFTVRHIPARYNVTTKTLEPPQEVIKFEDIWGDEEQLIKWISHREHLVHEIARRKMEKYVEDLQQSLKGGQTFSIPGVGHLRADAQGAYHFTAEYLPIELETLMVQPVIRADVSHRVTIGNKEVVNNQVVNHLSASAENAEPGASYPEYPGYPEPESTFRWWWVAVPAAAVLAAALVWWMIARQPNESKEPVISADREAPVDTARMQQDSTTTVDSSSMQPAAPETSTYYVIIEQFRNAAEAQGKLNKRHGWGQTTAALLKDKIDTNVINLVIPATTPLADTAITRDSISKVFAVKPRPIIR